ncbi:beta-ketoacyl synthase N-terminal-like domain-containing protein [Rubrolithibacter danxiaensis]|uniref:beta-ketoacyl synthase N-terminal-like domain-containing protein n=1 Tax=Rubrolithibacter danxiaensis TaxID=3390805 RepID=UPI003BF7CA8E
MKIAITGYGSISPLGADEDVIWENYLNQRHCFIKTPFGNGKEWTAPLLGEACPEIKSLSNENSKYKSLDPSVWYAMAASRKAVKLAGWRTDEDFGINIGSSRGATISFEKYYSQFIENDRSFVDPLASPTTTLGNIASWVAADLGAKGPAISHSITCSTALHAVVNAAVWLKSGFCTRFLAGGSESALTPFTIAQMKALKIYSQLEESYPCRSMEMNKKQNTMILGEGAASFCLEADSDSAFAYITGIGYGTEVIKHGVSITDDAFCLQQSMKMALKAHDPQSVDAIVMHSPGTIKGDSSERNAIEAVFGSYLPLLTSNKWKIGHTFGASGALSMEMALLMMKNNTFIQAPYLAPQNSNRTLKKVLINAVGFGGNAVSILMETD